MKDKIFFLESSKHGGGSINSLKDNISFLRDYFSISIAYYRKNDYTNYFDDCVDTYHCVSNIYTVDSLKRKMYTANNLYNPVNKIKNRVNGLLLSDEVSFLKKCINDIKPQKVIGNISPVFDRPLYYTSNKIIQHVRTISGINEKSGSLIQKNVAESVEKLIYNSHYTKEIWEKNIGVQAETEVIYNPFKPNVLNSIAHTGFNIGIVARLQKQKNHLKLIKAVAELPPSSNVSLYIYGEGAERSTIENYIKVNDLTNVFVMGNVKDKQMIYGHLDLVVLPSYHEALGRVLIEAMSFGIPVLGSDRGGIPEIIADGYNGYLINPDDHSDIVNKIMLVMNKSEHKKLQKGANRIFGDKFAESKVMPQLLKAYQATKNKYWI